MLGLLLSPEECIDAVKRHKDRFRPPPKDSDKRGAHRHAARRKPYAPGTFDVLGAQADSALAHLGRAYHKRNNEHHAAIEKYFLQSGPSGESIRDLIAETDQTLHLLDPRLFPPLPPQIHEIIKFEFKEHRVVQGVTRVLGRVEFLHKNITLGSIAKSTDPRSWMTTVPELFTGSYRTDSRYCELRQAMAEPVDDVPAGYGWSGLFFEAGQMCLRGLPLLTGRIVLNVDYGVYLDFDKTILDGDVTYTKKGRRAATADDLASQKGIAWVEYNLYEALQTTIMCLTAPGGPDVDHSPHQGMFVCLDEPTSEEIAQAERRMHDNPGQDGSSEQSLEGALKVTAQLGKHLRYSADLPFAAELNVMALPIWYWAVSAALIRSVLL